MQRWCRLYAIKNKTKIQLKVQKYYILLISIIFYLNTKIYHKLAQRVKKKKTKQKNIFNDKLMGNP